MTARHDPNDDDDDKPEQQTVKMEACLLNPYYEQGTMQEGVLSLTQDNLHEDTPMSDSS